MAAFWQEALGLQEVGVEWSTTTTPGGKAGTLAHTYIKEATDFQDLEIEIDPELSGEELEVTIVHELLHVAMRHAIGFAAVLINNDSLHALLFEEDTESLAKALVKWRQSQQT